MSNQNSRTEFVLSTDGKIIKRKITESEKELTAAHLSQLEEQNTVFHKNIFTHGDQPVILGMSKNSITLTMRLGSIRIKTNYTIHNGVLVPAFDRPKEPVFDLSWVAPVDMNVYFVLELDKGNEFIGAHMMVMDEQKRCHRLPLGNIYEHGQICMGDFDYDSSKGAMGVFNDAFTQFDRAPWNNDLMLSGDNSIASKLFRFKPKGDGFEQLEATGKWQDMCSVIAPPILNFIKI